MADNLVAPDEVVLQEPTIQVRIDYPLHRPVVVMLHGDVPGGGFTRRHLLESLGEEYCRIYEEEQEAAPLFERTGSGLYNRCVRMGGAAAPCGRFTSAWHA